MSTPFVARYKEGRANTVGLFHGRDIALSTDDIESTMTAMDDTTDCFDPIAAAAAAAAGSASAAHGEEAAAGHGEVTVEDGAGATIKAEEKGFFGAMMAMIWGGSAEPAAEVPADHSADKPKSEAVGH